MSTPHDDAPNPAERTAQEAVRTLPRERPDAAFRAQLRHEFSTGRIGRRRERLPQGPWFARPAVLVPLAAGVALAIGLQLNRGPDWRVVAANGDGRVWVGERAYTSSESAALARAIQRGGRVRVEGATTLDLVSEGMASVAIGPDAEVLLSAPPNRVWGRAMRAHVTKGNTYFTTGARFRGASLAVTTADAQVLATGTSFAVLKFADATCVCVMEGHVHVGVAGAPAADATDVPEGMRRVVTADGKTETHPILEDSEHHLHEQQSRTNDLLGR